MVFLLITRYKLRRNILSKLNFIIVIRDEESELYSKNF